MKELTIEEKARRYDEAIEIAKEINNERQAQPFNVMTKVFPELAESENEKMVKFIKKQLFNIKKTITDNYELDTELTKAIDWLEKQGKNNMGISEATKKKLEDNLNKALEKETPESWNEFLEKQDEPVSEDEIEKQFKAGDVVVYVSRQPAYSGLYLLGNPNDLSIGYSNANEPYQIALRNCTVASEDERKQFMRELDSNGYKWNEGTLRIEKEEPVSEDLEEAVNAYIGYAPEVDECSSVYGKRQAFKAGANWQAKQMIAKAVDAEVKVDAGGYPYIPQLELYDYDKDVPLANEGDKYKVILIKEK